MYQRVTYADFGVERVRYSGTRTAIAELLIHRCETNDSMTQLGWYTRHSIIDHIKSGQKYMTIQIDRQSNTWHKGADIHVVRTSSGEYLRTDQNQISADNLGNLPEG